MSAEPSLNRQDPSERDARASRSRCADRGSRLAADWKLPPEWKAWAQDKRPELNADLCAETFADYWHAKPGKDALKADWFSTCRNWVRKERGAAGTQSRMPSATGQPKTFSSVDYSEAA